MGLLDAGSSQVSGLSKCQLQEETPRLADPSPSQAKRSFETAALVGEKTSEKLALFGTIHRFLESAAAKEAQLLAECPSTDIHGVGSEYASLLDEVRHALPVPHEEIPSGLALSSEPSPSVFVIGSSEVAPEGSPLEHGINGASPVELFTDPALDMASPMEDNEFGEFSSDLSSIPTSEDDLSHMSDDPWLAPDASIEQVDIVTPVSPFIPALSSEDGLWHLSDALSHTSDVTARIDGIVAAPSPVKAKRGRPTKAEALAKQMKRLLSPKSPGNVGRKASSIKKRPRKKAKPASPAASGPAMAPKRRSRKPKADRATREGELEVSAAHGFCSPLGPNDPGAQAAQGKDPPGLR